MTRFSEVDLNKNRILNLKNRIRLSRDKYLFKSRYPFHFIN